MNKAQEPGKRIVSKSEYARVQGTRTGLRLSAGVLYLLSLLFALNAGSCLIGVFFSLSRGRFVAVDTAVFAVLFLLMGGVAYLFRKWGKASMYRASVMGNIVPLTRANTADLPAPDTLVRASSQPAQAQEATLLRASVETQERHEEQLLRASGEQA